MVYKKIKNKIFDPYGIIGKLKSDEEEISFYCMFQPLRYKNKIYLSGVPTEIGFNSMKKYLIMTSPLTPLQKSDGINCSLYFGSDKYLVDHCEIVYLKTEPLYNWAIIHKEDSE